METFLKALGIVRDVAIIATCMMLLYGGFAVARGLAEWAENMNRSGF
jgi:hypothetical protein